MLRDLTCTFPVALQTLADAERAFGEGRGDGGRLCDLIYPLARYGGGACRQRGRPAPTDAAQPALGAVSLGAWRVLASFGVRGDAFAGHSYGELVALCAAGRIRPQDLHVLSRERGRLMAAPTADEPGGMIAVHAPAEAISGVLKEEKIDLVVANKNAPQQSVLSGSAADVQRAADAFQSRQIRATPLAVSGVSSPQVAAVEPVFRATLEATAIEPTAAPVYANTTAAPYPDDAGKTRDLLAGQLARPVSGSPRSKICFAPGCAPSSKSAGRRLTGLVSAILSGVEHEVLALDASNGQRSGLFDLACCLACLAVLGYGVNLKAWDDGGPPSRPQADGKHTLLVPICGANYVKPKPARPPLPGQSNPARLETSSPETRRRRRRGRSSHAHERKPFTPDERFTTLG